jgi:hypothetical protein
VSTIEVQGKVVSLSGRVANDAQRTNIRHGVQNLERGIQVKDMFQTIQQPLCAVLDLLEPVKKLSEDQASGVGAGLNKQGNDPLYGNPIYVEGENTIIDVWTPAKFDSYIYIDYFMANGKVFHLFPDPKESSRVFPPNQKLTVGDSSDPRGLLWEIQEPFGLELVAVIASKSKLFSHPRSEDAESTADYIAELRQAIPRNASDAQIAATFYLITTRPKQ